jgi:hypothetical protein
MMKARLATAIRALIVANIAVVALLLTIVVVYLAGSTPGHPAQTVPGSDAAASPQLMSMGLAHIPTSSACVLCHEGGGSAALKVVPALAHPLEGWRRCVTCHTNEVLGRTAPGHDGIPEEECLNCHKVAPEGPSITQPHSQLQDQKCLDCHGTYAHLPSSMVGRNETECWICHKPTALPPPAYPHELSSAVGCRACHQSPEVGGMPIDHARRTDETCLLCHEIKQASPAPGATRYPLVTPAPSQIVYPTPTPGASAVGG